MALTAGTKLGPYKIHSLLGFSGGYRVRARNKGERFLVAHYPGYRRALPWWRIGIWSNEKTVVKAKNHLA
jgi:hypothetical protein